MLALAAGVTLSGCQTLACVERDPVLLGEVCRERVEYVFAEPPLTCQGEESVGSCAKQGFTVQCDAYWLKPGSACQ